MKQAIIVTVTLILATSFVTPLNAQTVGRKNDGTTIDREAVKQAAQLTNSTNREDARTVLYEYIQAIASRNYQAAYNLHSSEYRAQVPYEKFVQMYQDSVSAASISSVELLPAFSNDYRQEFRVQIDATYIRNFPTANGRLPEFFILVPSSNGERHWVIDGMAPGP